MQIRKGNKATPKGPRESAGATLLSQLESAKRPSFHKKPSPASIKKKNAQTKAPARAPVNTTHATKRARFAGFTSFVMSAPFHSPRTHCLVQTSIPEYAFICSVATRPARNRSGTFPKCDRHIKRYAKKALAYRRDTTRPARSPGRKRRLSQSENRDGPKPNSPNQSPRRLPQEARH